VRGAGAVRRASASAASQTMSSLSGAEGCDTRTPYDAGAQELVGPPELVRGKSRWRSMWSCVVPAPAEASSVSAAT